MLKKTPDSPLQCKEIKPVSPKGNQSWRTNAETEAPILWPPDMKGRLIGKDPDVGKDSKQEEKGTTEDQIDGWYHWFNGPEFDQALRYGEGRENLTCWSPWGHKESDTTEWLNKNKCRTGIPKLLNFFQEITNSFPKQLYYFRVQTKISVSVTPATFLKFDVVNLFFSF